MIERILRHFVGRSHETRVLLAALECGRSVFLEGPPGTSKSTVLGAIVAELGRPLQRLVGNSDLTAAKMIGYFDPAMVMSRGYKPEFYEFGPLTRAMNDGGVLYIEEFNRLPDDCTNALISAISERTLPVPRLGTVSASDGFCVVGAMNSETDVGTSRLSAALRDRFCSIRMDYQSTEEEIEIVRNRTGEESDALLSIAVELCRRSRKHEDVRVGASVRGAIDVVHLTRNFVDSADELATSSESELLQIAARAALREKLTLTEVSRLDVDGLIDEICRNILGEWNREHGSEWTTDLDLGEKKRESAV